MILCFLFLSNRNDSTYTFDMKFTSILNIKILRCDVFFKFIDAFKQMNFILSSFWNKNWDNFPHGSVEKIGSDNIKVVKKFRITIVENGHKFLHWIFWDLIWIGHVSTIENNTNLVSFLNYLKSYLLIQPICIPFQSCKGGI